MEEEREWSRVKQMEEEKEWEDARNIRGRVEDGGRGRSKRRKINKRMEKAERRGEDGGGRRMIESYKSYLGDNTLFFPSID